MNEPTIEWGGYEPPKAVRRVDGIDALLAGLRDEPGRWAKVSLPGVKPATLHTRLALAGCEVVTRNGGEEIHAMWPPEEPQWGEGDDPHDPSSPLG